MIEIVSRISPPPTRRSSTVMPSEAKMALPATSISTASVPAAASARTSSFLRSDAENDSVMPT